MGVVKTVEIVVGPAKTTHSMERVLCECRKTIEIPWRPNDKKEWHSAQYSVDFERIIRKEGTSQSKTYDNLVISTGAPGRAVKFGQRPILKQNTLTHIEVNEGRWVQPEEGVKVTDLDGICLRSLYAIDNPDVQRALQRHIGGYAKKTTRRILK